MPSSDIANQSAMPERWDLFCRVVDNFGDAGVCWRLAWQLAHDQGGRVRIWIDDLRSLSALHPAVENVDRQTVEDIEVRRWDGGVADAAPADFVIDAFGCGLPDEYVENMAAKARRPLWIVLEYLSAEPWVPHHHGLPSPHPRLPLQRYFFFPGFVEGTGGLLREHDLFVRREAFGREHRDAFWQSLGYAPPPAEAVTVSVFSYESAPLAELLRCWELGPNKVVAAIAGSNVSANVLDHFGVPRIPQTRELRRGALEARFVPFVAQARYDELLWSCDWNFVRGEDSFVRAQWAARPFVWQAYPQQERAHWQKLNSFLDLYCGSLSPCARAAVYAITRRWNEGGAPASSAASAWAALVAQREELQRHSRIWAERIAAVGPLTANLASFCRDKLK